MPLFPGAFYKCIFLCCVKIYKVKKKKMHYKMFGRKRTFNEKN